jgi:hypothetical protein
VAETTVIAAPACHEQVLQLLEDIKRNWHAGSPIRGDNGSTELYGRLPTLRVRPGFIGVSAVELRQQLKGARLDQPVTGLGRHV